MSAEQADDDIDIYGDLPYLPCPDETVKELEEAKKLLELEIAQLKEKLQEVTNEKIQLDSQNKILGSNISSLYKTATAEIERKDRMIADLRKEKDSILFRRKTKKTATAKKESVPVLVPETTDNNWNSEEVDVPVVENDNSEPYYDYPIDVDYEERDFNNYYSNNTSTHAEQPPQEMETIFSKRQKLRLAAENTPPVNPVTSKEEQNSDVPWCLIPLQETETTAKSSHHRNAYVSKDRSPVLQTESRKELEYSSHNRSRRETKTDDKYDGIHDRTRKSVTDSSRSSSTTLKDSVSRHSRYRDEYKSYSKYKSEKYSRSDDRSRKYSSSSYSRWGTHRPPRSMREASVSRALRSLRSRSVSQCRSKVKSVIVMERKTSEVKYSAIADASSHSKSSSKPDTTKPGMKKQTQNEVQNKNSENQTCKTKDKDGNDVNSGPKHSNAELPSTEIKSSFNLPVNNSEPEMQLLSSFEDSSKINSSENGTELQVNSTSKIMKDQTKIDDCKDKSVARLSEHFSFKRSGRTKIVKLNNEKSLGEAMKPALKSNILENEKSELTHVPDQKRGTKRSYENEDENDVQLPLFKRKALDDITRKECYNNTDDIVTYSKPNNDRIKQANTDLARENSMKNEKCSDESASLKDMDISEMKTIDETKERKDQEDEYMVLDIEEGELCDEDDIDKRRTEIKEILSKKDSKSGDTRLETRDKNIEKRKDNGSHHGDRSKLRSERRFSDSKRKTAGSSRSEYSAKRGYERSRTPFRFNSHCKRRSPSELLTGNRSGRMSRDRDIRSRSFEDVSKTYRGPERHNIIDNLEGKGKKHEDKRGSSEEKKREKSSKDEPKKLSSNQRDVEKMEKHEYNTENVQEKGDSLKIGKKNHKEESQTRKDDSSRKHDDSHDKIKPLEKSVKRGNKKCTDKEVLLPGTEPMITDKVIKTLESRDSTKSNPCGNKSNNETSRSRNSTCEDENVHVEMKKNNGAYYSLEDGHATTSELLENTFLGSENENCNKSDKSLSKIEEIKSTSTKDNKTHIEEDGDHRNVEKICVEEEKEDNSVTYNSISRTETSSINEPSDSIQRKSSKQLDTDVTRHSTSEKNPKTLPPDLNNITEITRNRKEDKVSKSRSCESRSDYVHEKEDEELQQKVSKELNIEQTESSVTVRSENKKREMTKIKEGDDFKQKHEHISRNEITDDRPLSHSKQELETKERHGSKREKNQETNVQDKENEESQQMCKQLISEQIEPVETVESENKKRKTAETIEVVKNLKQKHEHTSRSKIVEDRPLSRLIQYDPTDCSKTELETKERYRSKREKNQKSNVQDKENEESQEMCKQLITEQTQSSETVNSENKKREMAETNEVIHDFKQKHEHASRSEITEDRPLSRSKQYDPIDSFKIEPETNERHRNKREKRQDSNVQDKENESQQICKQLITEQIQSNEIVKSEIKNRLTAETNEVINDFKQKHEHTSRNEITEDISRLQQEPETKEGCTSKREKSQENNVQDKESEESQHICKELISEQTMCNEIVQSEKKKRTSAETNAVIHGFKQKHEHTSRSEITEDRPPSHSKQEPETKERRRSNRDKRKENNVQDKENEESQKMCNQLISEQTTYNEIVQSEKKESRESNEVISDYKQKNKSALRCEITEDKSFSDSKQCGLVNNSRAEVQTKERHKEKKKKKKQEMESEDVDKLVGSGENSNEKRKDSTEDAKKCKSLEKIGNIEVKKQDTVEKSDEKRIPVLRDSFHVDKTTTSDELHKTEKEYKDTTGSRRHKTEKVTDEEKTITKAKPELTDEKSDKKNEKVRSNEKEGKEHESVQKEADNDEINRKDKLKNDGNETVEQNKCDMQVRMNGSSVDEIKAAEGKSEDCSSNAKYKKQKSNRRSSIPCISSNESLSAEDNEKQKTQEPEIRKFSENGRVKYEHKVDSAIRGEKRKENRLSETSEDDKQVMVAPRSESRTSEINNSVHTSDSSAVKSRIQDSNEIVREIADIKPLVQHESIKSDCKVEDKRLKSFGVSEPAASDIRDHHKAVPCGIGAKTSSVSVLNTSPPTFRLRIHSKRRSRMFQLEDSRTVLSVNITPPSPNTQQKSDVNQLTNSSANEFQQKKC